MEEEQVAWCPRGQPKRRSDHRETFSDMVSNPMKKSDRQCPQQGTHSGSPCRCQPRAAPGLGYSHCPPSSHRSATMAKSEEKALYLPPLSRHPAQTARLTAPQAATPAPRASLAGLQNGAREGGREGKRRSWGTWLTSTMWRHSLRSLPVHLPKTRSSGHGTWLQSKNPW